MSFNYLLFLIQLVWLLLGYHCSHGMLSIGQYYWLSKSLGRLSIRRLSENLVDLHFPTSWFAIQTYMLRIFVYLLSALRTKPKPPVAAEHFPKYQDFIMLCLPVNQIIKSLFRKDKRPEEPPEQEQVPAPLEIVSSSFLSVSNSLWDVAAHAISSFPGCPDYYWYRKMLLWV